MSRGQAVQLLYKHALGDGGDRVVVRLLTKGKEKLTENYVCRFSISTLHTLQL